jgi:hypothetical protein
MNSKLIYFLMIWSALAAGSFANAQASKDSGYVVEAELNSCELSSLHFDMIGPAASQSGSRVFVIFRAGTGESDLVNKRRLEHVRRFLTVRKGWNNFLEVIYAHGESVRGQGRIEFYQGEFLVLTVLNRRNMSPCMDCCGPDALANPQNLLKTKRKSKRPR